jgi:hypothetical protein
MTRAAVISVLRSAQERNPRAAAAYETSPAVVASTAAGTRGLTAMVSIGELSTSMTNRSSRLARAVTLATAHIPSLRDRCSRRPHC